MTWRLKMNRSAASILFSVLKPLLVTRKKTDRISVRKTLMQVMTEKIIPLIIMNCISGSNEGSKIHHLKYSLQTYFTKWQN
jgi:hypothetical protein